LDARKGYIDKIDTPNAVGISGAMLFETAGTEKPKNAKSILAKELFSYSKRPSKLLTKEAKGSVGKKIKYNCSKAEK
jgi:hypothetical protein